MNKYIIGRCAKPTDEYYYQQNAKHHLFEINFYLMSDYSPDKDWINTSDIDKLRNYIINTSSHFLESTDWLYYKWIFILQQPLFVSELHLQIKKIIYHIHQKLKIIPFEKYSNFINCLNHAMIFASSTCNQTNLTTDEKMWQWSENDIVDIIRSRKNTFDIIYNTCSLISDLIYIVLNYLDIQALKTK